MIKYRVNTEINTITKEKRFSIQYKSFFKWHNYIDSLGVVFYSYEATAKRLMDELNKKQSWI